MSERSDDKILPPKREKTDYVDSVIETAIAAIPVLGGPAIRLFNLVITPPLESRLNIWRNEVSERILKLEEVSGFKVENLGKNPMFITAVMQATQIALRNHQKEKLEALQNAVVNSARGTDLEEDLQLLFLNLVDSFTALHLRILKFLDNPRLPVEGEAALRAKSLAGMGLNDFLEMEFPELKGQSTIYDPIVQDLFNRGLLKIDKTLLYASRGNSTFTSHTTDLGKKFLRHITS